MNNKITIRINSLLLLLLMLVLGGGNAWADDYSGTYYIAFYGNSSSGDIYLDELDKNYYLCPTEEWIYYDYKNSKDDFTATDTSRPFLTTYQWLKQATYDINKIKWTITKNGEYYNLCNGSGKYLVANGSINTSTSGNRLRVHLEETNPSTNDHTNFIITKKDGYFFISPKNFKVSNSTCYLNVTEGNKNSLQGVSSSKNDGPEGYREIAGTFGFWNQANNTSQCAFIIPSPTFSLNNDNKVEITALGDAEIYYTTDGSNPVVPAEGASPSTPTRKYTGAIDLVNGQIMIKAIATNKDHRVVSSSVATYVYNPDITWSETSFVYNGSPQTPTEISVKVGDIVVDATKYSTSCSNNTNAGTATLKLSDNDDKDNYYIVEKTVSFTIEKASISPTVSVAAKTYDGTVVTPSVSGNSGNGTVTYAYKVKGADDATYSETAPVNAGEYTVKASIAETINYLSGEATVDFTIAKAALTITAKGHSITYGDTPANDGVTYEGFVNSETASVLGGTLAYDYSYTQFGDVGNTYTITPKGLTSDNYDISFIAGTLTVAQKEVGLTWSETTSFPYDGAAHAPTATATGLVNSDAITVIVTGEQTNAGNHTATASELTGEKAGNYKLPEANTHAFSITKVPLTVTAQNHSITYGDAPANNGVEYDGFVGGETSTVLGGSLDYDYSYTQYDDVGDNYTITPKGLTSNNYNISYVAGTLTVNPKALTITADAKEKAYGDDDPALTYTPEGLVGTDVITGVLLREEGEDIGTYAIHQNTVTASSNYTITYIGANFTITPRPLTITAKSVTITYGNEPTNDGVTYSGFAPGEDRSVLSGTLAYAYNYEQFGDVGSYTITPSGLTGANYNISFVAGTLTVNPREVGLVWSETTTFPYDGASHCLTATATGMVNDDVIAVNVTGAQKDVGVHTATASSLTGDKAGNYKLPDANTKEFSITKAVLTVTAKNHSITYGDAPAGNGVTYEGFVNSETASVLGGTLAYDYSYTQFGDVGTYTITPKGLTSDNYDISFVAGTLTVGQKEVGISWSETTTFPYDGSLHAPTATATATSLVNGDVVTVIVSGAHMNAGNHTAVASALEGDKAGNYKLPELPEVITKEFTITRKSIGDGTTLADGYSIDFGEGNSILLTDEIIGRTLAISTDYTVGADTDPSDKYAKRIVKGINNYTGSFEVRNVVISFNTDTDQEEWSATFAAENADGYDIGLGLALPEGVSAYIISDIRGEWAIPEPLNYIPAGVPVLLVAHKKVNGFVVTKAESGDVTPITDAQIARNMLEEVTAATPGYDSSTESAHFATKQIYILYKNEFVFNKAGDMKKGKVYLNPNHTATSSSSSSSSAPARLLIGWNDTTGMEDVKWKMEDGRSERWYTIDGRRLSGKPNAKGIYIVGGKKIVVK